MGGHSASQHGPIPSYHFELISLHFFDLRPLGSPLGRVGWTEVAKSQKKSVASDSGLVFTPLSPTADCPLTMLHVCALFRVRRLYRPCVLTPLSHRTLSAAPAAVASRGRSRASKAAFTAGHRRGAGRCVIHQDHHKAAASVVGVTLDTPP